VSNILAQLFDLKPEESVLVQRRKIEDRGRIVGLTDRTTVPLMGYLLGWYQDDDRLLGFENNVAQLRSAAINLAATLILNQSARRPLVLLIDNLHWADSLSIEWIKLIGTLKQEQEHGYSARQLLMIVGTRPHLETTIEAFKADEVIHLPPLSEPARADMIASLLPGGELPGSLVERLAQESGGNPFYLEEAARGLVQSEQLVRRNGKWELTRPIEKLYIPHSIEGQVMAHLDILSDSSRLVLQHASVIGQEFDYNLLAKITPVSNIDQILEDLIQRALIKDIQRGRDSTVRLCPGCCPGSCIP
jgi:adenylate cyclase